MSYQVKLIDYDEDLFEPVGFEADLLSAADAGWSVGQNREPEDVLAAASGADVVMVQSLRPLFTRQVIERLAGCRGIIRVGIGYDSVDVAACTEMGIALCNVPEYCTAEVAEHALALLLASTRHLARQDRIIRTGVWDRSSARPAHRLNGRVVGLVGFGRVARAFVEQSRGLNWRFLAFDPLVPRDVVQSYGVEEVSLEELLSRADMISIHAPLTAETRHLLGKREFDLMKVGATLVNTSRGPVVDEAALLEALRDGKVASVGLDVFEVEPLAADNPLLRLDNVILTPHVAGYSEESIVDMYRSACQTALHLLDGTWPVTAVNHGARDRWLAKWAALPA